MEVIKAPLQFYTEKLKNMEHFSLARYGDGELYCIWGRQGKNSNGCYYTPNLRIGLIESLIPKDNFIFGMQRVLPHDLKRAQEQFPHIQWYDSEIFGDELVAGNLYPFLKELTRHRIVIIGNSSIRPISKFLKYDLFIEVPPSNAFEEKDRVYKEIFDYGQPAVYLFSCGMAANVFISELHGKIDHAFLIDIGHIWDAFVGNMSRCNLEGMTQEQIDRNLYAPTN